MGDLFFKQELNAISKQQIFMNEEIGNIERNTKAIENQVQRLDSIQSDIKDIEKELNESMTQSIKEIGELSKKASKEMSQELTQIKTDILAKQESNYNDLKQAMAVVHKRDIEYFEKLEDKINILSEALENANRNVLGLYKRIGDAQSALESNIKKQISISESNQINELKAFKKTWWKRFWWGWIILIVIGIILIAI